MVSDDQFKISFFAMLITCRRGQFLLRQHWVFIEKSC